jgi:hypothetical protein
MTTCIEKVFMAIVFLEGLCCWEVVSLVTLVGQLLKHLWRPKNAYSWVWGATTCGGQVVVRWTPARNFQSGGAFVSPRLAQFGGRPPLAYACVRPADAALRPSRPAVSTQPAASRPSRFTQS